MKSVSPSEERRLHVNRSIKQIHSVLVEAIFHYIVAAILEFQSTSQGILDKKVFRYIRVIQMHAEEISKKTRLNTSIEAFFCTELKLIINITCKLTLVLTILQAPLPWRDFVYAF